MRRSDREVKDRSDIISIMRKCDVVRLGINDEEVPYILPLNFFLEEKEDSLRMYFHSALEGHKMDIMKDGDKVFFEMDTSHEIKYVDKNGGYCTMLFESVMGKGIIHFASEDEKLQILTNLMDAYHESKGKPFSKDAIKMTAVYYLDIEDMTGKRH